MKKKSLALICVLCLALVGCARGINYQTLNGYMKSDDCSVAAEYVKEEEKDYGMNQKLLFLLDSAMISMLCGEYEASNHYLHRAEDLAETLWTKSITKETASFLLNDYTVPYAGEDFERALINLFSAINYLMLGNYDEALVECRRLDANLLIMNEKYENKNVYKEDAFGRYLSGIIYESVGNLDDAFIDYYRAFQVYQDYQADYGTDMPNELVQDLMRTADATGRMHEIESYLSHDNGVQWLDHNDMRGFGKIVLIHFNGRSPVKIGDRVFVPTKYGPITIAFPRYIVVRPHCRGSEIVVETTSGSIRAGTALVEDINSIAVKNLNDRKGRIMAKTMARVVAKQVALNAATQGIEDDDARRAIKVLFNILNIALERADTRAWRTLPGEIYLSRLFVPPGTQDVYITICDGERRFVGTVNVVAGETTFLLYESMY